MPKAWRRLYKLDGNGILAGRLRADPDDSAVLFFPTTQVLDSK